MNIKLNCKTSFDQFNRLPKITPSMILEMFADEELALYFLEQGVDPLSFIGERTPLEFAFNDNHPKVAELIIDFIDDASMIPTNTLRLVNQSIEEYRAVIENFFEKGFHATSLYADAIKNKNQEWLEYFSEHPYLVEPTE